MQVEEDLGYVISAETLPAFHKVGHFITYIEQVEAFKAQNNKAPLPWMYDHQKINFCKISIFSFF